MVVLPFDVAEICQRLGVARVESELAFELLPSLVVLCDFQYR